MRFQTRPHFVEAVRLKFPLTMADGAVGAAGDWLVVEDNSEGEQLFLDDATFHRLYVPLPLISDELD